MATTALFVEILVIGTFAGIWIGLAILATTDSSISWSVIFAHLNDLAPLLILPLFGFVYALGWVVNFLCERMFKLIWEDSFRDPIFEKVGLRYAAVRAAAFQHGSGDALKELRFGRHIVRLARSNCVQFPLLAGALLFHIKRAPWPIILCATISLGLSVASFFQWKSRYRSYYHRMLDLYSVVTQRGAEATQGRRKAGHEPAT